MGAVIMVSQLLWVVLFVIATQWVDISDSKFNLWEGDIALHSTPSGGESKTYHPNPNDRDQIKLWKDGLVPYMFSHSYSMGSDGMEIDEDFAEEEKEIICRSLKKISDNVPCIKFKEVSINTEGAKLIFSTYGDRNPYPTNTCWAYLGQVGDVGGRAGQTVNIHKDCLTLGALVHLVMHSLGATHQQIQSEYNRKGTYETEVKISDMLELAQLYENQTPTGSCFKQENIAQYFDLLVKEVADLKKSCSKGSYYLYLSDTHVLELPSFTKAKCHVDPYPVTTHWGLSGAVAAILDGKLHICGGGGGVAFANCYALHGTSWMETLGLSVPRQNAGGSMWMGGWLVTGGINFNTRHTTSDLYRGGVWTAGPNLDKSKFWSNKALMGVEGHCQVTVGSKVIVAGGRIITTAEVTAYTFSWDGKSWKELSSMKAIRDNHACVEKDGFVFAIGGQNRFVGSLASVEKLNLATGVWSDGPALPFPVEYVQAVNIHGDLYVVGGKGSGGKILKLADNMWEHVSNSGYDDDALFSNPPILSADQIQCQ